MTDLRDGDKIICKECGEKGTYNSMFPCLQCGEYDTQIKVKND